MSSIFIETSNESQLTVEEYVRYAGIKEKLQKILEDANIEQVMSDYEKYINGLTIDLAIKYSIDRKRT